MKAGLITTDQPLTGSKAPSRLVFADADLTEPLLTIAIPTLRRFEVLAEAMASALAQTTAYPFEIIVVDNDPTSRDAERLVATLPRLREARFRYYVNDENIGMFGNWNRSVELGRGTWHTMLHDDDLLLPAFVETLLGTLNANPRIDGLACRKRNLDQRDDSAEPPDRADSPRRFLADVRR